jgi:serine/threonine-protein kinase
MLPHTIGRYEIRAQLGRGGMATVYHAFDPRFKREVAVKVLPREFLHDPQFRARFEREAQTIAALEHSAIVPVYDFGEEDGQPHLVMRLMNGGSLVDRLRRGPLPLAEAARIFGILAPALDEAHAHGVIHRDLKPGNILFDQRDQPYLSDFGIAKLAEGGAALTATGIIGTPAYMSPEQARGDRDLDGRSDLYAMGAILFEMLTGRLPYDADTPMGLAVKHITEPVPRILTLNPELPPAIETVIGRAMAKSRTERYPNTQAMAQDVAAVARGETPRPAPTGARPVVAGQTWAEPSAASGTIHVPSVPARPASRTWQLAIGGLAIGGVCLIGLALVAVLGGNALGLFGPAAAGTATDAPAPTDVIAGGSATSEVVASEAPTREPATAAPASPTAAAPQPSATAAAPVATARPTSTYPPVTAAPTSPAPSATTAGRTARITGIRIEGDRYVIDYVVGGYAQALPGPHVHFFFDTVPPNQAGVPGAGPWQLYGGPSPFTGYTVADRPAGASQMCILVANADHSVEQGTGNCWALP